MCELDDLIRNAEIFTFLSAVFFEQIALKEGGTGFGFPVAADIGHYQLHRFAHSLDIPQKICHVQDFAIPQGKLDQAVDKAGGSRDRPYIRDVIIIVFLTADFYICVIEYSVGPCVVSFYCDFFHVFSYCSVRSYTDCEQVFGIDVLIIRIITAIAGCQAEAAYKCFNTALSRACTCSLYVIAEYFQEAAVYAGR